MVTTFGILFLHCSCYPVVPTLHKHLLQDCNGCWNCCHFDPTQWENMLFGPLEVQRCISIDVILLGGSSLQRSKQTQTASLLQVWNMISTFSTRRQCYQEKRLFSAAALGHAHVPQHCWNVKWDVNSSSDRLKLQPCWNKANLHLQIYSWIVYFGSWIALDSHFQVFFDQ